VAGWNKQIESVPEGTAELHMNFIQAVKDFFKAPKVDPVAIAVGEAFSDASDTYDAAYSKLLAAPTEPAEFDPYTEAHLNAFTAEMDVVTAAFDSFTAAFDAFKPTDERYALAANLYKATCTTYKFAANGYSEAASRALLTALEGNTQVCRDAFKLLLLEDAARLGRDNLVAAKAKAAAFKAKLDEDTTKAKALEQKATVAKTKAAVFLSKAVAAEERAKEALEIFTS
jgi:hypothetical protein